MTSVDVLVDQEERDLRHEARRAAEPFLGRAEENDRLGRFPEENFADLRRAGLLALTLPRHLDGRGASYAGFNMVAEEIARADASTCLCFTMHCAGVDALANGNDEQQRHCARLVHDGAVFTMVFSEPGSGAHFLQPQMTASPVEGGYRLNGRKSFATSAGGADLVVINAVVDGTDDGAFTLFVVEPKANPGIEVTGRWDAMGMRANDSRSLSFADAFVPVADRLGAVGEGRELATGRPSHIALGLAACSVGIASAAVDMAAAHAASRVIAPGTEPVAAYQGIQFLMAEMAMATTAMSLMALRAARTADHRPEEAGLALTQAKAFCNEQGLAVANNALQVVGGRGYLRGHQAERLVRDARAGDLMALTAQQCREVLGRHVLGLDRPPPAD